MKSKIIAFMADTMRILPFFVITDLFLECLFSNNKIYVYVH